MKLISCYIENFGGLQNFSLEFSSTITVINEPNGFGKTTFAAFIRTMFYGFPRNSKTMGKNDRKKFIPWQSGTFGGNIVFEHEGQSYRVERTFGATPKSDTFTLYKLDPLTKCDDFSEQLGLDIFGLDADSFERSTYMPQMRENSSFATAGIQAKLGNLVEDTNDINSFDDAVERLKKERNKKLGHNKNSGMVLEIQRRIAELELKIRELVVKKTRLSDVAEESAKLENEISKETSQVEKLREELSRAYSAEVRKELEKQHKKLLQDKAELESQLSIYEEKCTNAPNEDEFKAYSKMIEKLTADKALLGGMKKELEGETLDDKLPTIEELDKNREKLSQIDDLRRITVVSTTSKKKTSALPIGLLGIALVVVAVVLFVMKNYALGAAAVAVGAVLLIGAVYLSIKNMVSSQMASARNLPSAETEAKIAKLEAEVRDFVSLYDVQEENLFDALSVLKTKLERAQKLEKIALTVNNLQEEVSSNEQSVLHFLSKHTQISSQSLAESFNQLYIKTRQEASVYADLLKRKAETNAELDAFVKQNAQKLGTPMADETIDTEQLKLSEGRLIASINDKNRTLSDLKLMLRNLQNETDLIPELEDEMRRLEQQKNQTIYKGEILDKTMEFLTTARDSLSMSYLGTVKKNFVKYMQQLSQETGDTLFVDRDFEVTLERRGVARELGYFSAGYSDIVMLCMRFALVDALFPDTKPFIILDDPFINLDDSNTKKAIDLLKRLGEDRQIIYLVCNSSRSVEQ